MNHTRKILYRGELQDSSLLTNALSPFFNYGQGFFETILYDTGNLHLFDRHLKRMERTCLDFSIRLDFNEITKEKILSLLDRENLTGHSSRVKIIYAPVTNGAHWDTVVTAAAYTRPLNDFVLSVHDEIRDTALNRYKLLNYGFNLHWKQFYHKKDHSDEVLFLNKKENFLEGSYTNLLFAKNSALYYTGRKQNYLQGIMQNRVLDVAASIGLEIKAMDEGIHPEILKDAEEVMVCNSLILIKRVRKLVIGNDVWRWESEGKSISDELCVFI